MADTIREKIIADYETKLAAWRTSGGYTYDCGGNQFRAKQNIDDATLPAVVIWPGVGRLEHKYSLWAFTMTLRVEALVSKGSANIATVQEAMLGDMLTLFGGDLDVISSYQESASLTAFGPAEPQPAQIDTAHVYCEFEVKYHTGPGDPYTQA